MNRYKYMFKELYVNTNISKIYKYKNTMIKRINIYDNTFKYIDYKNEYEMLKFLDNKNENIIKIKEDYMDSGYYYTVMDYYSRGDLYYNIKENRISISNYKEIINNLIDPIYTIHKNNIVHLDIKLENYLLNNKDNKFTLIDFNLSKFHNCNYYELQKVKLLGTKTYIAPEIYDGYYCKSSDMYSLGCLLYKIYARRNTSDINLKLLEDYPRELVEIIENLLDKDYNKRLSVFKLSELIKESKI